MYRSLFSVLKPLIYNGESGFLTVDYVYGGEANIYLKEGLLEGIETDGVTGVEAAKTCARWLSISTRFINEKTAVPKGIISVDTNAFLSALEKIDARIEKIQQTIPGNDALFKIAISELDRQDRFSPLELKVILLLDGSRSVEDVLSESKLSEVEVLSIICKLESLGVAKMLTACKPMARDQRESFLGSLKEILNQLVGPIADILISDAFEAMNCETEHISENEIPHLIKAVGTNLKDSEIIELEKWSNEFLNKNTVD